MISFSKFLSIAIKNTLKTTVLFTSIILIVACSEEAKRSEVEYINVATEAHTSGDSRLALFELASAIKHYPENADLQILRGKIFLDLEDGSASEIAFNKAIALGYNRNFILHELAQSWLYQRNPAKVIEVIEKEIDKGAKDALLYEVLGRAYIASRDSSSPSMFIKNMDKATEYIEEAYRLNPNSTRVLISKAWIPAMMDDIDAAIDWLDKANLIIKDQRENLAIKGELLIRKDNLDSAEGIYQTLVKKFPQYPQYKLELGHTLSLKGDYVKAREWVAPIAQQYPDQPRARYLMANISLMEKKYEDAKNLSDAILANNSNDLKAVIINGASSYFLNDFENAHQKLTLFYNNTNSIPALKLLAATKLKLGENQAAAKLLEKVGNSIQEFTDMELLNLYATASAKIGKIDKALEGFQKLAENSPNSTNYKNNIGNIQIAQGNYEEGFKNLEKALLGENKKNTPDNSFYILANKALQVRQYDRAADYIEKYKKEDTTSYRPWLMSAVLNSILKNSAAVRLDFQKAIELSPDVAEIRARYAIYENMQGNREKALELAHEALKLSPSDIGAGKLLLSDYINQKKFDDVKNVVENALKDKSASPSSKLLFADYHTLLGRPQETLNVLNQLPESIKKSATFQLIAGKAYLRNGQPQSAVDMLEDFTLRSPNNIQALKYLLRGYLLTKNQRKYTSTLEKIDRLSPNDYGNQIDLVKLYISTGKYNLAEKAINSLNVDNDQQKLQKSILLATLANNQGDVKKALSILSSLNQTHPNNGAVAMLYSRNLALDGQVQEAISISQAWADKNPDNMDVKKFLGDLYLRHKDILSAEKQYEEILTSQKSSNKQIELHAHNNLAMISLENKNSQKAMMHAQKAIDMAPNNPVIIDTYAQVLMLQGKTEKAIDYFDQALSMLPNNDLNNRSNFSLGKAKALIQLGKKEQARRVLKRLKRDNPDYGNMSEVENLLSSLE